jgi:hypothetical protein
MNLSDESTLSNHLSGRIHLGVRALRLGWRGDHRRHQRQHHLDGDRLSGRDDPRSFQRSPDGNLGRDIVGNDTGDPAILTNFDDNGTPGILTDGYIAFRVRLGEDKPQPGFTFFFGVGLDANADGVIDLFLAVDNNSGGPPDQIGIFSPGTGANTSPSTTSIITPPLTSYAETAANYDFSPVTTIDPLETNTDLDAGGKEDQYLTFVVPFDDIVTELGLLGITFDENSTVQYVFGTSTQSNALNQDLGGPDGGTTSTLTWDQLGAISLEYSASGTPVPEPSTALLLGLGLVSLAAVRRLT